MSYTTKNRLLIGLLLVLLLANIATITIFWLGRLKQPPPLQQPPAAYLVKTLGFDETQKNAYRQLVKEHRSAADSLKNEIGKAKDDFYSLLQQPAVTDAEKIAAAKNISLLTEKMDLVTFDHFKKVRSICNTEQQRKFDAVITEVMHMIGRPGQGPPAQDGPHRGPNADGPPPPAERDGRPPLEPEGPPPPPR